jgi:predicted nucleic acid-binding protein
LSYLIDTNVLSELKRKLPDAGVVSWFSNRPPATLYLSVLTLGEIRKGIETLADEARRQKLIDWLETDLPDFFTGRILAVDGPVADRWGRIAAAAGRPLAAIDSLLAATAVEHDLVLVTRNEHDFVGLPVQVFNPWSSAKLAKNGRKSSGKPVKHVGRRKN